MGRRVEGDVRVVSAGIAPVKIKISGKLYPKRKVPFIEELKRLGRLYGLDIKVSDRTSDYPKKRSKKKRSKKRSKKK
jgi:hypothetical protein